MANLTRFGCMKWSFEMTICWDVEMIICWNIDWLLFLRPFAEVACINGVKMVLDRVVDDWCLFLKKFREMNVYGADQRSPMT